MTQNANWPLVDVAVAFGTSPTSPMPAPYWCSVKDRTLGQISTNRGRQYELDQVQTGTWAGDLENTDAALDPANSGSPFYPNVVPYRAFRHRAQYPATVNILTADQATAGAASGLALGTLPQWVTVPNSGYSATTVSGRKYACTTPATYSGAAMLSLNGWSVTPGQTYSAQVLVDCQAGTPQSRLRIYWYDVNGSVISTADSAIVTTSTAQQQMTVTGAAPANAVGADLNFMVSSSGTSAVTINFAKPQVEVGPAPTTWVQPGTWYSLFTGYVERWPQSWAKNGLFGTSSLVAVDAFGFLSQRKLLSAFYHEVSALNPAFFYPLDESPNVTKFSDYMGKRAPAEIRTPYGYTTVADMASGSTMEATGSGWLPGGIGGPVLATGQTQTMDFPAAQYLDLTCGGQYQAGPATSTWTRMFAFRYPVNKTLAQANVSMIISDVGADFGSNKTYLQIDCRYDTNGNLGNGHTLGLEVTLWQNGSNTAAWAVNADDNNNMSEGGWHFVIYGKTPTSIFGWYDGQPMYTVTAGMTSPVTFNGQDTLGANRNGDASPTGYIACVAEFPFQLTDAQASQLYSTFRYGGSGLGAATSGLRYQDILRWGNWAGLQAADTFKSGETSDYGPATEINATASSEGTDVVSALQTVVDTDAGSHYVAADGTVTFKARRSRYNKGTPVVVFGENTGAGEVPYTNVQTGYDPTRVANDISVIQTQTSDVVRALDSTSANAYGDIQLQRTVNTLDPYEQTDAANYLLRRNSQPVQRVESLQVDIGANPSAWASMLKLELGTRVRVMRRPPSGAATIQVDGFVEQINWTFDDKGHAYADLQISVNNSQQYWQLDSSTYSVLGSTSVLGY